MHTERFLRVPTRQSLKAVFLFIISTFLFFFLVILLYGSFLPDDAYIHMTYAHDIAAGNGFSFAGNKTYGTTSPMWPMLIAAGGKILHNIVLSARVFSFIFTAASLVWLFSFVRLRLGNIYAIAAMLLMAGNGYFIRWSLSGMEATASCAWMLLLLSIVFLEGKESVKLVWYLLLGFSPLVRPEFYLFLIVAFIFLSFKRIPHLWKKFVVASIPIICWNTFAYFYYGTIVPTTFQIKAGDSLFSTDWETISRTLKLIVSSNPIEISIIIVCGTALLLKYKASYSITKLIRSPYLFIIALICSFYLYYILKNVTILSRYSLVLLPPIIVLTLKMAKVAAQTLSLPEKIINLLLAGIVMCSLLLQGVFTARVIKPDADNFVQGFQTVYTKMAMLLRSENKPNSAVAVSDVGIIGLYSGMKVDDFVGLTDRRRFECATKRGYFAAQKPEYLIFRGEFNLYEVVDTSKCSLQSMYSSQFQGLGINNPTQVQVNLYRVYWK